MTRKKTQPRTVVRPHHPPTAQAAAAQLPTVSPRWLLTAVAVAVLSAALCAWGTLCLLFWQGSWQLLYHPKAAIVRTPASAGIAFESVGLAAVETGQPRLQGWWIPAAPGASPSASSLPSLTILYLHGATGNMSDTVDTLARFHALGANVLAFDYRGYGQSQFAHPSEARLLEDANSALDYLTQTRHAYPHSIVLAGNDLGADLAVEIAAAHPDLAGAIVESPVEDPASVIFKDSRAGLLPAHLFVKDRYDLDAAAGQLRIPSLWLLPSSTAPNAGEPTAYGKVTAQRKLVRLTNGQNTAQKTDAIAAWLASLANR